MGFWPTILVLRRVPVCAGKMHDDEADIDDALVRRLLTTQFPQWAALPIKRVASDGTVNAMYRLGEDMAVRLPLVESGAKDVAGERQLLTRLAPLLPVAIPVPLGEGMPTEDYPWPWSVYRWLAGENPVVGGMTDPDGFAMDLADFVTALRGIDPTDGPPAYRGGPLAEQDAGTRSAIEALDGMIDTEAATAAWDECLSQARSWAGPPVWVHGDLMPGNLLTVDGRLNAVIDFGTVGVGDPACDLIAAWNLLPVEARKIYRDALQVDDAAWARGRGRALSMALIQLPYYKDTNPGMAANARHVIKEVLADHARSG
jgi:aminoglycoside phosphotransferase (APT) family kinase protein